MADDEQTSLNMNGRNGHDDNINDGWSFPPNSVIEGDLDLSGWGLTELPKDLKTVTVLGRFICSDNLLVNLENSPKYARVYYCANNPELTSLAGATAEVDIFNCDNCPKLKDLVGGPTKARLYSASRNAGLQSLNGAPETVDTLIVNWCPSLKSLREGPKTVHVLDVSYNSGLVDLSERPKITGKMIYDWDEDIADAVEHIEEVREKYKLGFTKPKEQQK